MNGESGVNSAISLEVLDRGKREREFFNRHTTPSAIPDEVLKVPVLPDAIPEEVASHVPELSGKQVCEFGCGYGVLSSYFAQRGALVCGFDVA
jgi:2-polyprenyl-3-methyl-5-hydroxy-6-metoxy-1,4-benzoquinol methylase